MPTPNQPKMPTPKPVYVACNESDVPERIRFDVPGRNQGQIVEVAYGAWPRIAGEADEGDAYQRVIDRGVGPTPRYYRLAKKVSR